MSNSEKHQEENPLMNLIQKNFEEEKEPDNLKDEFTQNIKSLNHEFDGMNDGSQNNQKNQDTNYEELVSSLSKLGLNESSKSKMLPNKKQEQNNNFFNPMNMNMNMNNKNNQKDMGAFNYFFGGAIQDDFSKKLGENSGVSSQILDQLGYNQNNEKNTENNPEINEENQQEEKNNFKIKFNNNNMNMNQKEKMKKKNNQKMMQTNNMMMQMNNNNNNIQFNNNVIPNFRNMIQQDQQNMMMGNNNNIQNLQMNQNPNQNLMMNYQRNQNNNNNNRNRKKKNKGNKINNNNNNNVNIQNMNLIMNNNQQQVPYNYQQFMPNQNQLMNNYSQNHNYQNKNQYNMGGYIPNNMNNMNMNRYNIQPPQMQISQEGNPQMNMIGMNMGNQNSITLDQLIARANNSFPGKFYVIKSIDESNILSSIRFKIWCSTIKGNQKLQKAYKEADKKYPIFLFFSVNSSGKFMGIALMTSDVEYKVNFNYWSQNDKWKGFFVVDWICIKDVPNKMFRHIINDLNEGKPVTSSRDTQEICTSAGVKMLKVFRDYPQESTIFDSQNEIKYIASNNQGDYNNNFNMGRNNNNNINMNYIENRGNMVNMNMNMGNISNNNNMNINNMKNINNMQNMNNIQNNRNNLNIIKNLNNKNQNIPNMNINIMPNMNSIPNMNNNYNPMMKFGNNEQGIPQNQMINDINEFQKNNPNLKKMNFEDLMKNANNNFEKEKKSEPYDINMILNKKGDKEDSEENDK